MPVDRPFKTMIAPGLLTLFGLVVLVGLGLWQLHRLEWKEDLIARVEARTKATPITLAEAIDLARQGTDSRPYPPWLDTERRERFKGGDPYRIHGTHSGWGPPSIVLSDMKAVVLEQPLQEWDSTVVSKLSQPEDKQSGIVVSKLAFQ